MSSQHTKPQPLTIRVGVDIDWLPARAGAVPPEGAEITLDEVAVRIFDALLDRLNAGDERPSMAFSGFRFMMPDYENYRATGDETWLPFDLPVTGMKLIAADAGFFVEGYCARHNWRIQGGPLQYAEFNEKARPWRAQELALHLGEAMNHGCEPGAGRAGPAPL